MADDSDPLASFGYNEQADYFAPTQYVVTESVNSDTLEANVTMIFEAGAQTIRITLPPDAADDLANEIRDRAARARQIDLHRGG